MITKIDDTTVQITTPQPDKVETLSLDELNNRRQRHADDLQRVTDDVTKKQAILDADDALITQVQGQGIITKVQQKENLKKAQPVDTIPA